MAAAAVAAATGDHAPKKHSPLASPALNGNGEDDEEEEKGLDGRSQEKEETVEQALEDAERTEMDLGVLNSTMTPVEEVSRPTPAAHAFSPPRSGWDMDDAEEEDAEEEEVSSSSTLSAAIAAAAAAREADEGFASASPPSSPTTTRLEATHAVMSGDLDLARIPRGADRTISPTSSPLSTSPTTSTSASLKSISLSPNRGPAPMLQFGEPHAQGDTSPFGAGSDFGSMDVDVEEQGFEFSSGVGMEGEGEETSALGLDTEGSAQVERDEEGEIIAIDEESLSALERIFICAKSEAAEER